jgi:hypothetical protein
MGADGHIRIYDADAVKAKANELGCVIPTFWYECDWLCNGKKALIAYWGDNLLTAVPWPDGVWDDEKQKELKEWANEHAVIVDDQEVWT